VRYCGLSVLAFAACAPAGSSDIDPTVNAGGKGDLPNAGLVEAASSGGAAVIAGYFQVAGFDVTTDVSHLAPAWPLRGDRTPVLNRMGTPLRVNRLGYFHDALDVTRSQPDDSAEVLAPFAGMALVTSANGAIGPGGDDYDTLVAIWDPTSHVVAELMHVRPASKLPVESIYLRDLIVPVAQGEVIGQLADNLDFFAADSRQRLRHTHVRLVDGGAARALDPARWFRYHDHQPPTLGSLYVLDESGRRFSTLVSGRLDVVVEAWDRDDDSRGNLEVAGIAYEIFDDQDQPLLSSPRCTFTDLIDSTDGNQVARALSLIDFGNASGQMGQGGVSYGDFDDPTRTFRYALTQFFAGDDGRCQVLADRDGYLDVTDETTELNVHVQVWDHNDNTSDSWLQLQRDGL
jgi:hypothetical protein